MKRSVSLIAKSLIQLPITETLHYLIYQVQLRTGLVRLATPLKSRNLELDEVCFRPKWFDFPAKPFPEDASNINEQKIVDRADLVLERKINLFGEIPGNLTLDPGMPLAHWSKRPSRQARAQSEDIKFIWEPARFGWSIHLGQAFFLTQNEKYAQFFWEQFHHFMQTNPYNMGPNWASAQEVALRLMAWITTLNLIKISKSSTPQAVTGISRTIADHADRITATLSYARAQNNNHILSEAAGLYTAGCFLPNHPRSQQWRSKGLLIFENAIQQQIGDDGEYIQHSTQYHRLMLSLAIWMRKLLDEHDDIFSKTTTSQIGKAVGWLSDRLDKKSGRVPNLGHNDGSWILPFSTAPFRDFRPIIQAASNAFLIETALPSGKYDDLSFWLSLPNLKEKPPKSLRNGTVPIIGDQESWGLLRATKYHSRPAHADQLHVDLWYQGQNVLMDPGTYQYNLEKPWDNGLAATRVHNTITIQEKDQMTRAGRFLWVDWAQAHISEIKQNKIVAAHDGYIQAGAVHERTLKKITQNHWQVIDHLYKMKAAKEAVNFDLHYLVPDYEFSIKDEKITFSAPFGCMQISVANKDAKQTPDLLVFRAGISNNISGKNQPLLGWFSPTYGLKIPALSILYKFNQKLPSTLVTDIIFS